MSEKIWMVGGTTGEYSDRTEWVVDAWRSEQEAKDRVQELTRLMQEIGVPRGGFMQYEERGPKEDEMRKHDPAFQCDYTGSEYYICELELKP
jgi:hypothetical protein